MRHEYFLHMYIPTYESHINWHWNKWMKLKYYDAQIPLSFV